MRAAAWWLIPALALAPALAAAHTAQPGLADSLPAPGAWSFEPWVVGLLLLAMAGYALGTWRVWRRAGRGRGVQPRQLAAFVLGWLALAAALLSPLDALGAWLFSAHMVQHELLMVVAAPLLVIGRPLAAWAWAFSPAARPALRAAIRSRPIAATWRLLTAPLAAWALHALALWLWHVPRLFDAALHSEAIHVLQHASFLASALLFWWAALGGDQRVPGPWAIVLLLTTMLHTSVLGALLTFAATPWYSGYAATTASLGLTPLDDQQIGGLVMWVPGGLAYLVAGLALALQWFGDRPQRPHVASLHSRYR
ncbi:cytochrome c oxidase assembly protein [Caenimonas terrae]|uniref:Cytochrome c oxidase assembly protein n=1 Tax=Caenimonas terrae TaxID=696074 RepID=A0ABW0NGD5_9BURK